MLARSLFALTLFAALHAMFGAAWVRVSDPDVWWVAAAGREMIAQHSVPTRNLFSFVEPNTRWIMHEWSLGPVYAFGLSHVGPSFFVLLALSVLTLGLILLLRGTLGRAEHALAGVLMAAIGALFFLRRLQTARPSCVALLFPLLFVQLAFAKAFTRGRFVACVLLEWLWTNVHGSFPLGIALLIAAAIERVEERRRRLLAVVASSVLSAFNPYGFALHRFVFDYALGQRGIYREIHRAIPEFGSLWSAWGSLIQLPELLGFALVTLLSVAALATRGQRLRGVVCLGLQLMAARQARHLELAGLIACVLLVPAADRWVERFSTEPELGLRWRRNAARFIVGSTCALGAATFAIAASARSEAEWIDPDYGFFAALPEIRSGAHLYVPFRVAGM
ncbi:MAG TPA: hypothetical protein VGI70_21130, partial [Polyangiales bacterium]